ncbi:hypothetical protein [Criblamydia sequanensis]|uniref:Membrane protein n=1 Tax=Candidatus Criblamydia sequanensis CRIB-18 TaxID=1437425 RepID=A0A090D2K1_9BACT|nr:hypothetical protein [Criblamydia sequanensis]CDR34700.1 putative membrane protein [Criblamydia sequanensis CRIB-18]
MSYCNLPQNNIYPSSPQNLLLSALEGAMIEFHAEVEKSLKELEKEFEESDKDQDEININLKEINKDLEELKKGQDKLAKKTEGMKDELDLLKNGTNSPPPRDLEKERITKLQGAKNKAIIYAAALITCIVINIIFCVLAPLTTALSSLVVFAGIDYFLGSSMVREIREYNNLKKK